MRESLAATMSSAIQNGNVDWSNIPPSFLIPTVRRPSSFPTPEEVRRESRERSSKVLSDWEALQKIIDRHEEQIQKRWRQKTKIKRRQILLSAWPNMPKVHRPDFEAFKKANREESRDAYLWPHINLEDMEQPRPLLLLLKSRARNAPHLFLHADLEASNLGQGIGAVCSAFLNQYTMMFAGRTLPQKYGELISWDDHDDAFDWLKSGWGLHPGYGLLALEIQQQIYKFLLECTRQILHDITEESLIADFPVLPEPTIKDEGDWHSLAAVAADTPYRLPAGLDLDSIITIVDGKRSASEDHLLALREDPGYFAGVVSEYKEHRQEILLDTRSKKHPTLTPYIHPLFWNRVLGSIVCEAYMGLEVWSTLHSLLVNLRQLLTKYHSKISPEKSLPTELYDAFIDLWFALKQFMIGPVAVLKMATPASPPLRSLWVRDPPELGTSMMTVQTRESVSRSKSQTELLWILNMLWDDSSPSLQVGRKTLMDELERLVQSDPRNKELVSFRIASLISDLAVFSECCHQIELYQPWASTFENGLTERKDEVRENYTKLTRGWNKFLKSFEGTSLGELGSTEDGRFQYPVEKRRNRENVELMRLAEKNLDDFWRAVDAYMPVTRGMTQENAVYVMLSRLSKTIQRTPEWVEPQKQPSKLKAPEISPAEIRTELVYRTEKTTEPATQAQPKTKVKSRGEPTKSANIVEPELNAKIDDAQPLFKVDKRAFKVFSTLFFQPSQSSQPGEIPWNDFLHAMASTAFAVEKLYGSVWQFSPRNLDVERSIQFHEPHPIAKIPFRIARRIGRRLNRAYGWNGDMFVPSS